MSGRDFTAGTNFAANLEVFTQAHRQAFALHSSRDFIHNANLLEDQVSEKGPKQGFGSQGFGNQPLNNQIQVFGNQVSGNKVIGNQVTGSHVVSKQELPITSGK